MNTYDVRNAIHYFHTKIHETNHPYYWYYSADTQARAGLTNDALQTIDQALSFPTPYEQHLKEMRASLKRFVDPNKPSVVAAKRGDIDGDRMKDLVMLSANKTPDSPFWKNITLVVQNGRTQQYEQISLKNNSGYNPTLFLGDVTGDKADDILVVIDTGGSGGMIYAYIFSSLNGKITEIFNSDAFNETYKYDVKYENQYKAAVTSYHQERYILDLTYKGKEYLSEIYTKNGLLKAPIEG